MVKLDKVYIHRTEVAPLEFLDSNLVTLKLAACLELTRIHLNLMSKICARTVLLVACRDSLRQQGQAISSHAGSRIGKHCLPC